MIGARTHESASCRLNFTLGVPDEMREGIRELSHLAATQPGNGHGTQLMQDVCEEADRRHLVLVLIAQEERLARWYERFGFFTLPDSHGMMGRPIHVPAQGMLN